jgi:hypothetical protein
MNGPRFASIHLAVLSKRDRRWVLSRLTAEERRVLKPQLREALKMGPEKLREIIEAFGPAPMAAATAETPSLAGLDDATVPILVQRLPQWVVALLADKYRETWGQAYWAGLDEPTRRTLTQSLGLAKARVTTGFIERLEASALRITGVQPVSAKPLGFEGVLLNAPPYQASLDGSHG